MKRRTKIIATLGPTTDNEQTLSRMIEGGVNLIRVNLSHSNQAHQKRRILMARACAKRLGKPLGILADLQGPKIRISGFKEGLAELKLNQRFILDPTLGPQEGSRDQVGLEYKSLADCISSGDELLLDDGRIVLKVTQVESPRVICEVKVPGLLLSHKGLNRRGGGLAAPVLTDKDIEDIQFVSHLDIDYLALSFPKSGQDLKLAREHMRTHGCQAYLIAKIERSEALTCLDEIIEYADGVMVARGDLGVEIGFAQLPGVQKEIISLANDSNKPVIVATQMMESMIQNPIPTRAEASDVANAVLDGADALMLSAETATGDYPEQVIHALHDICLAAEKQKVAQISKHRIETQFKFHDEAIAMAAMYIANHVEIKAIIALTESGLTPLLMSRIRSSIPIFGMSRQPLTCGRMTLFKGVHPIEWDFDQFSKENISLQAVDALKQLNIIQPQECVLVTRGDVLGVGGKTNMLKILTA